LDLPQIKSRRPGHVPMPVQGFRTAVLAVGLDKKNKILLCPFCWTWKRRKGYLGQEKGG